MWKKQLLATAALSLGVLISAHATDWNEFDKSEMYAPFAMHQGNYSLLNIDTAKVEEVSGPLHLVSVEQYLINSDEQTQKPEGHLYYRLNTDSHEAWIYVPETKEWRTVNKDNEQERKAVNKISKSLFGEDFYLSKTEEVKKKAKHAYEEVKDKAADRYEQGKEKMQEEYRKTVRKVKGLR